MHPLRQEILKKHLEFTMPFFKFSGKVISYIADLFVKNKYSPMTFVFKNMSTISIISVCTLIIVGLFYLSERKVLSDKIEIFWKILLGIVIAFWMLFLLLPLMIMFIILYFLFVYFLLIPSIIYILLLIILIIFKITFISPLMLVIIVLVLCLFLVYGVFNSNRV